jgi:hypothetical protein
VNASATSSPEKQAITCFFIIKGKYQDTLILAGFDIFSSHYKCPLINAATTSYPYGKLTILRSHLNNTNTSRYRPIFSRARRPTVHSSSAYGARGPTPQSGKWAITLRAVSDFRPPFLCGDCLRGSVQIGDTNAG